MSRGFVKEEDQEEAPFIPPRASLPPGVTNYVTPKGQNALLEERKTLETALKNLDINSDKEKRHATAVLTGKLNLLTERINSARVLDPKEQPADEVRFGATVTFKFHTGPQAGKQQSFTIVGVDEANVKEQKIAFLAPLAQALTGKKVGEIAEVQLAGAVQQLEIISIKYE